MHFNIVKISIRREEGRDIQIKSSFAQSLGDHSAESRGFAFWGYGQSDTLRSLDSR